MRHARYYGVEVLNFEKYEQVGEHIKEITHGGAHCVIDYIGLDGKTSVMEKIETALKLQGRSKSAIETASQCIRKNRYSGAGRSIWQ
ncbi:MAG: hypothetical protein ACLTT1_00225 [[Clostridium] scindens]